MAHRAGFVNIIGNPNVGKSTLMNALVGEKLSIVTAKAQTTRHRIMGIVSGEDYQIVYSDTVIGVQLGGKPLVKIFVPPDDTILVDIIERREVMAHFVAALEGECVLGAPGRAEVFIEPIRIPAIVIGILQHFLDGIALQFLVVDELLGVQHLRLVRKRLKDEFAGISNGRLSFPALLGGDENHTIACFCTIDSRGGRILEDLHVEY